MFLFIFIWSGGYPTKIIKSVDHLKPRKKKKKKKKTKIIFVSVRNWSRGRAVARVGRVGFHGSLPTPTWQ